jgi:hypothetical protein
MKTRKRQRRYRVEAEDALKLDMPTYGAEGGSATRQVTCLAAATHVWLEIGDMEWFLDAMHHQYTKGGVPRVQRSNDTSSHQSGVSWCSRDSCWLAAARDSSNNLVQNNFCVVMKAKRANKDAKQQGLEDDEDGQEESSMYGDYKSQAYDAAVCWQRQIEEGDSPSTPPR